ncbi:MAG: alpha/beta fold hydrolase [Vicinamibacteria bacterium]
MTSSPRPDSAQTAILLHSSGMSSRQWGTLVEVLKRTHRVIAPDLLGSGDNPLWPDEEPFDLAQDVDAIERLVDGLGEPVHVVGHSYGGLLALTLARRGPAKVRSLTAYDPVAFGVLFDPDDAEGLADLERAGRNPTCTDFLHGGNDAWFEVFVDYWNGPGAWRGMTETGRAAFLRVGRKVFYEVWSLMHDRTPASAYASVEAPSLFLGGAASPAAARRVVAILGATLPRGRVEIIDGAGHMGPLTHGASVNAVIAAHILAAS